MAFQGRRGKLGGRIATLALGTAAMLALPAIGTGQENGAGGPPTAGTIESFDAGTGVLTIALTEGGEVSGRLVPRTQLRCGRWVNLRRIRRDGHASSSRRGRGRGAENRRGRGQNQGPPVVGNENDKRGRRGGCDVTDLEEGAVVMKAELLLSHGMAFYKKVGLLPRAATGGGAGDGGDDETGEDGDETEDREESEDDTGEDS